MPSVVDLRYEKKIQKVILKLIDTRHRKIHRVTRIGPIIMGFIGRMAQTNVMTFSLVIVGIFAKQAG